MKDDLFDHLKHKLAETSVPDPDRGWQHMNALLDAQVGQRPTLVRHLYRYVAAASVLLILLGVWAFYHEVQSSRKTEAATIASKGGPDTQAGTRTTPNSAVASNAAVAPNSAVGPNSTVAGAGGSATPNNAGATVGASIASTGSNTTDEVKGSGSASNNQVASVSTGTAGNAGRTANTGTDANNETAANAGVATNAGTRANAGIKTNTGSTADAGSTANAGYSTHSRGANGSVANGSNVIAANGSDGSTNGSPNFDQLNVNHTGSTGTETNSSSQKEPASLKALHLLRPDVALISVQDLLASYPRASVAVRHQALQAKPASLKSHKSSVSRWSFDVGLGANVPGSMRTITENSGKKFEPGLFPALQVGYRLNAKLSLSTGVAIPSPVSYTHSPPYEDLVEIIDSGSTQTARYSPSNTKIGRLLYLDIPLLIKWRVLKHVSVEGGGQVSYLLHQQNEINTQNSTYFSNYYPVSSSNSISSNVSSVTYYYYSHVPQTTVQKIDPRYVVGAAFQLHRFSADLQYQGSLRQAATQFDDAGNEVNNRTSIVQFKVMYHLQ